LGKDARAALTALSESHQATQFHFLHHPSYIRRRPLAERTNFCNELARLIQHSFELQGRRPGAH
jgi:hypothetical protein